MEQPICTYCKEPLLVIPTMGCPDLDDWYCENADCQWRQVNQAPRFKGRQYYERTLCGDGSVVEFQRGRESQNEQNVLRVADAIGIWLSARCEPRTVNRNDQPEKGNPDDGADAYLHESNGTVRRVQITRAVDERFCAELGKSPAAKRRASCGELSARVMDAIDKKTQKWVKAHGDPHEVVLAVDVAAIDLFVFLEFTREPVRWSELQAKATETGWFDVILVGQTVVAGPKDKLQRKSNCWSLRGRLQE